MLVRVVFNAVGTSEGFVHLSKYGVLPTPCQRSKAVTFLPRRNCLPGRRGVGRLMHCCLSASIISSFCGSSRITRSYVSQHISRLSKNRQECLRTGLLLLNSAGFMLLSRPFSCLSFRLTSGLVRLVGGRSMGGKVIVDSRGCKGILRIIGQLALVHRNMLLRLASGHKLIRRNCLLDRDCLWCRSSRWLPY